MGGTGTSLEQTAEPRPKGRPLRGRLRRVFERLGLAPAPPEGHVFHGFISYSHASDGRLAPALQKGLQRFAKPWYRAQALRVFRDNASMAVSSDLWGSIEQALDASEHYILLASPRAAASEWVANEAQRWRETKPTAKLMLALTDGEMQWDEHSNDFDWSTTTALPLTLRGAFEHEPRFVDLRWARTDSDLSLSHPRFRDAVADLAAPLHGVPKDQLASEEVLQQRRAIRVRRAALAALATLTALAVTAGVLALIERGNAINEAHTAQSQALGSEATSLTDLQRASLLGLEAYKLAPTYQARSAIVSLAGSHELGTPLRGDRGPVQDVAFSPSGTMIASADVDGTVRLWSAATHRQLGAPLLSGRDPVLQVAFSPDGTRLAAITRDGVVRLWNLAGRQMTTLTPPLLSNDDSLAFSPDGRRLAVGGDGVLSGQAYGTVTLWDLAHGRIERVLKGGAGQFVSSVAFSPQGQTIATATTLLAGNVSIINNQTLVQLWDLRTDQPIGALTGATGPITSIAYAPDGRTLAAGSSDDTIRIWNVVTHALVSTMGAGSSGVQSVAFSPDGKELVTGEEDDTVRLWSVLARDEIGAPFTGHSGIVNSVAFGPHGASIASGSDDGTIRLWSLVSPAQSGAPLSGDGSPASAVAFSPDGRTVAEAGWDGRVWLWNVSTHRPVLGPLSAGRAILDQVKFSPNGRVLATAGEDGYVRLWNLATGREITWFYDGRTAGAVSSLAISPDGRTFASGDYNGAIWLWTPATRHFVTLPNPVTATANPNVNSLDFSPDGKRLASGSYDHTIRLWNVATRREIGRPLAGNVDEVASVGFSPDGRMLASAGFDGTIRLWSVATHAQLGEPLTGHAGVVASVAFSPDGRTLASAGFDSTVRLWDVSSHAELGGPLIGHTGKLFYVAFSPSGHEIASAGGDGTVRLWSYSPLATYERRLCAYIDPAQARALWRETEPAIPYVPPCR